jgi:hypothetical protein
MTSKWATWAALVVIAGGARAGTAADAAFGDRSVKGAWGFVSTVATLMPPAAPHPALTTGLGRISFDGAGGCSVSSTVNVEGNTVALHSSTCRYRVDPDGTGTVEAVFPEAPVAEPIPAAFVVVQRGQELLFHTTRFIVGSFVAHRQ